MKKTVFLVIMIIIFTTPTIVMAADDVIEFNNKIEQPRKDSEGSNTIINTLVDEYYADGSVVQVYRVSELDDEEYLVYIDLYEKMIPYIEELESEQEKVKESYRMLAQLYYHHNAIYDLNVIFNEESEYLSGSLVVDEVYEDTFYTIREYVLERIKERPEVSISEEEKQRLADINSPVILSKFEVAITDKNELLENANEKIKDYKTSVILLPAIVTSILIIAFVLLFSSHLLRHHIRR